MRICHISSAHHSGDGRIFSRACRGLVSRGHEVTLIINHDKTQEEVVDGVRIIPLKPRKGLRRRICSSWEAYCLALRQDADIFHFHDPELLPWMLRLKKAGRCVVFDSHEYFSDVLRHNRENPITKYLISPIYRCFEKRAVLKFDGLVAITDEMIDAINPMVANRCAVGNYPNLSLFDGWKRPPKSNPPIIATTGLIHSGRHCLQMVEALPKILVRHPGIRLRLSGVFRPAGFRNVLIERAKTLSVERQLELLGYVTYKENIERAAQATIGCAFFNGTAYARVTLFNRMFEYMFCGVPLLVSSDSGITGSIVKQEGCGLVIDSTLPESIAEAACRLLDNPSEAREMGERGRKAVFEKYNFGNALNDLISFYQDILSKE